MAVSRSPFTKKKNDTTTTTTPLGSAGVNPFEQSTDSGDNYFDTMNNLSVAGYVKSGAGDEELKTTVRQEKQKLDKAYRTALAKIARSTTLDKKGKDKARKRLSEIYETGMANESAPGIFSQIGSEFKSFFSNPITYVGGDIIKGSATAARTVQSGAKEIADLSLILGDKVGISNERSRAYVRGGYEKGDYLTKEQKRKLADPNNPNEEIGGLKFSFGDFKRQALSPSWRMMPQTGIGALDWSVDFGADMVLDPLNRIGVGNIRYMGQAGRTELAVKFGTTEMLQKYPELIGKVADIGKYGVGAIPREILEAEGIEYGLRFTSGLNPFSTKSTAIIPKTEIFQDLLSGRDGLFTGVRLITGAAARKAGAITKTTGKWTPASRSGLKAIGFGYKGSADGLTDTQVRQEIAQYTSAKWAKGFKSESYKKNLNGIKDLLREIRMSGKGREIYKLVESAEAFARSTDDELKALASRYKDWQDSVRAQVNDVRVKFNTDFGANMKEIGFVEDYLHHKMTDKAFRFAYGPKGQATGWFKDGDLTPMELGQNTGAAMYRKLRAPEVLPDGSIKYSQFMGEDIVLDDTFPTVIDKVNDIFRRKTGESYDFFETDIFAIADSYAYSMAAARGREAYVRRLLDFGDDVARIINKKVVPDKELLEALETTHTGLLRTRTRLVAKVAKTRNLAKEKADRVLATARKLLDEKDSKAFLIDTEIEQIVTKLNQLEIKLNNAYVTAAAKNEAERGGFADIHTVLIEQVRTLRSAIEQGRLDEQVAYDILKDLYLKVRPDAKRIPKSATELYNAVARNMGVSDTVELREVQKRLSALQAQLAETPPVNADELNDLLIMEQELMREVSVFETLKEIKMNEDYSENGLLYTIIDNLIDGDIGYEPQMAVRTMDTRPISPAGADLSPEEMAILRRAQLEDPNTVAVHALEVDEIADLRDPAWFVEFWHPESGVFDAVKFALDEAGVDADGMFGSVIDDIMRGDTVPDMFADIYPELNDMLEYVARMHQIPFEADEAVSEEFLVAVFQGLEERFRNIAKSMSDEGSDVAGKQMYDDFIRATANEITGLSEETGEAVLTLFPSKAIYGFDNPMAEDAWSIVMPDNYNYVQERFGERLLTDEILESDSVMFTADNPVYKKIENDEYHLSEIELMNVSPVAREMELQNLVRQGLESDVKSTAGKIGGMKSAGSRRVKAAERALNQYNESGLIDIVDDTGKKVKVTRDEAVRILNKAEAKLTNKVVALEDKLVRATDRVVGPIQRDIDYHQQRLATLVDQKKVIEKWNDDVGNVLRADIESLTTAINTNPPSGMAGTWSRIWSQRVTDRINNIAKLEGTGVKDAWERVATQLGADEANLAMYDAVMIPNSLRDIDAARFAGLADDILDGWKAIESTGVQIPKEMGDILKPNIEMLRKAANSNAWFQAYKRYNQIFKIYATMTPGFVVRNAYSAAFMNKIAGVDNKAIMDGTKAMIAYHKHGPDKWLDVLNITDAGERAVYEEAMRSVMATGRGIQSDFISPALKGTLGERLVNNKATELLSRANEFTENAVRFPMALDSMRRGYGYDESVRRISRYHFDYTDLSKIDEGAKNFIPFWVWTTRNLPLQIVEQMVHPKYYNMYNRLQKDFPVSSEVILPSWLVAVGPLGFMGGSTVFAPDLPHLRLADTAKSFVDPKRLLGQANPLIKLPVELMGDRQLAMDIPFTDEYEKAKGADKALAGLASMLGVDSVGKRDENGQLTINPKVNYALSNLIPTLGTAQRLSGGAIGGKATYNERMLSSWLTAFGIPVRNVGERQQRGEAINRQFKLAKEIKNLSDKGKVPKSGR